MDFFLSSLFQPEYYKDAIHFRRIGDGPEYRLEIPRAKLDYTGTYSAIATNCHGESKAIISLQIFAKGNLSTSNIKWSPNSLFSVFFLVEPNKTMDKMRNIRHGDVDTLPIFAQQLKDLRCCDGDSVRLECHVEGKPEPQIVWQKDGKQLNETSDDFTTNYDGERATLTIKRVYPEDEGEYVCIASNSIGETISSACIIVDG